MGMVAIAEVSAAMTALRLTPEQRLLLACAGLAEPAVPQRLDWLAFAAVAESHSMAPLVYD